MDRFTENIDKQIAFNRNKNILLDKLDTFRFSDETLKSVSDIGSLNPESKQLLIDYSADKAMEAFCRVNQYYTFDSKAKIELKKIYAELLESLSTLKIPLEEISKAHYSRLKKWLLDSNPFSGKIYSNADREISPVRCSEYTEELQIDLLKIDVENLVQPVLDIGCGKSGSLVNYLANHGIEVRGIDRFPFTGQNFVSADWLEYQYGTKKWGTLISNLGFSNHFNHHNLRKDGKYIEYARTYMNILHSLKIGGRFHYAPDLPFIEKYLDSSRFSIEKHEINGNDFKTTIITRLK